MRHRTMHRGLAASTVVLLLVAQLAALVHHVAVRHVQCEHGELVEAAVLAEHAVDGARFVAVEGADSIGDEHCTLANGLRSDNRLSSPQIAVSLDNTVECVALPVERVASSATPIYRSAPKTSPPA